VLAIVKNGTTLPGVITSAVNSGLFLWTCSGSNLLLSGQGKRTMRKFVEILRRRWNRNPHEAIAIHDPKQTHRDH
jgi:hypothetical protein